MEIVQEILDQLYRKVLLGTTLEDDVHGYIFYLNPDLSEQDGCPAFPVAQSNASGVLDGMAGQHGPSSHEVATLPGAQECPKRQLQMDRTREMKLLQLTVIDTMLSQKMLSNSWVTFCQKHLSESSESGEAVRCLWILTAVIKEILKDTHSQRAAFWRLPEPL